MTVPSAVTTAGYRFLPDYQQSGHELKSGAIRYSAVQLPGWASLDLATGAISGTPTEADAAAAVPVVVAASDGTSKLILKGLLRVEHVAHLLGREARDFYATDFDGKPRTLRNDLSGGELQGEVQFVQSTSVAPHGNFAQNKADETQSRYMPRIIALRQALLLFMPQPGTNPTTVDVEVSLPGAPLTTLHMQPPEALPQSDFSGVEYSTRAWSAVLPWDSVKNGLELRFVADKGASSQQEGTLPASDIDIGKATLLAFQSIRLGMLTHPDADNANYYTLRDPVLAATDYFQTSPVSKIVMGSYADMTLDRVIISSGKIYDKAIDKASDSANAAEYYGDMRENVAKSQVSVGINMANYGYTSNNMQQSYPAVFKQITIHHAYGAYWKCDKTDPACQPTRVGHGLSGGGGIATLFSSMGNEASHEWGHNWVGHYPGANLTSDERWKCHHADSGWGYFAYRNRMRANITSLKAEPVTTPYNYHCDSMSSGTENTPFSVYTDYTGFSERIIQNEMEKMPEPDAAFPSGYKMWNTTTGEYDDYPSKHPVPVKVGVPVATLLGGYDPKTGGNAVIYPVFHGNYGNLFNLAEPDASGDQCWVDISNAAGSHKRVKVAAKRHANGTINQLHFNLDAEFRPTHAALWCRYADKTEMLTETAFDGQIPALPPAAVVGQDAGYQQLRVREMAQIDTALLKMDPAAFNILSSDLAVLVDSYNQDELQVGLSPAAWQQLSTLLHERQTINGITAAINLGKQQNQSSADMRKMLVDTLTAEGFIESADDLELTGGAITGNGWYFNTLLDDGKFVTLTQVPTDIGSASQWTMDKSGRLHPTATPWLCLTPNGGRVGLAACDTNNQGQRWSHSDATLALKNAANGQCLDLNNGNKTVEFYGCHGNWNQRWTGMVKSESRLLALGNGALLKDVYERLLTD